MNCYSCSRTLPANRLDVGVKQEVGGERERPADSREKNAPRLMPEACFISSRHTPCFTEYGYQISLRSTKSMQFFSHGRLQLLNCTDVCTPITPYCVYNSTVRCRLSRHARTEAPPEAPDWDLLILSFGNKRRQGQKLPKTLESQLSQVRKI